MKTAKAQKLPTWEIECPECQEQVEAPDGSLIWMPEHVNQFTMIHCQSCGKFSNFPPSVVLASKKWGER